MPRYVDAEKAHIYLNRTACKQIRFMPTADVAEVKHGEWLYFECVASHDGAISGYGCSVCSAFVNEDVFDTDEFHKKCCGNCGAKMDFADHPTEKGGVECG